MKKFRNKREAYDCIEKMENHSIITNEELCILTDSKHVHWWEKDVEFFGDREIPVIRVTVTLRSEMPVHRTFRLHE